MLTPTRLRCATYGHKWEDDAPTWQKAGSPQMGLPRVWVTILHCERDGCERERVDVVHPKTGQLLTRYYRGKIERLGKVQRDDLRLDLLSQVGKKRK